MTTDHNPPTPAVRRLRWLTGIALLLFALLTIDYWAYPYGAPMPGQSGNRGENGLWMKYTWYFGEHSPADVDHLAADLTDNEIRYAYFHVRAVNADGSLKYRHPEARAWIERLHRDAPSVKVIAWIYAGNPRGLGEVDLSKPQVRKRMVDEALWLVNECGFDGVQWDYEICPDGDHGLVDLLRETRAALPPGKLLLVCTAIWMPGGFFGWNDDYFGEIARNCDQMTVMAYDTAAYLPRVYVDAMHAQVVHVSNAVAAANPKCRVIIGIPTYEDGTKSHNPHAENIDFALRGVREGLDDPSTRRNVIAGVAVFADYTTDQAEWATYRRHWLGR